MYYIPSNYDDSGKLFNGLVETRKFIETSIISGILLKFLWTVLAGVDLEKRVFAAIIIVLPVFIFGLIGINGDSLTQFLGAFFAFFKNRKRMRYRRVDIDDNN